MNFDYAEFKNRPFEGAVLIVTGKSGRGEKTAPTAPDGWQRASRFRVSQPPLTGPYLRSASTAYCEQVGVNRHEGGVKGEMQSW